MPIIYTDERHREDMGNSRSGGLHIHVRHTEGAVDHIIAAIHIVRTVLHTLSSIHTTIAAHNLRHRARRRHTFNPPGAETHGSCALPSSRDAHAPTAPPAPSPPQLAQDSPADAGNDPKDPHPPPPGNASATCKTSSGSRRTGHTGPICSPLPHSPALSTPGVKTRLTSPSRASRSLLPSGDFDTHYVSPMSPNTCYLSHQSIHREREVDSNSPRCKTLCFAQKLSQIS